MIDHISFSVNDFAQSATFYDATLATLGYERIVTLDDESHQLVGYGKEGKPSFWIGNSLKEARLDEEVGKARGFHVGFVAPDINAIHTWYEKCLELGGKDNGKPGPRPEYHPGYYGAFIIDPNGWRIEACLHHYQPE